MIELEVGQTLKTLGGWDATVVWKRKVVTKAGVRPLYFVVHCPGNPDLESVPILHDDNGLAKEKLAVDAPPAYSGHPADLIIPVSLNLNGKN